MNVAKDQSGAIGSRRLEALQFERILRRRNAAFCIFEIAGFYSDLTLTANHTYVGLHGPGGAYQGSYPDETLEEWAARIRAWSRDLRAVYVYFDNDQGAFAVENALALKHKLTDLGA